MVSKRIVFLWTSDEEIGSESSRVLIESEAAAATPSLSLSRHSVARARQTSRKASARPKSLFMAAPRMPAWPGRRRQRRS